MIEFKYVVVKAEEGGEQIFIFPKTIDHDRFAEVLSVIRVDDGPRGWKRPRWAPVSAGFTDGVRCYGRSETLNLDSRMQDSKLLSEVTK